MGPARAASPEFRDNVLFSACFHCPGALRGRALFVIVTAVTPPSLTHGRAAVGWMQLVLKEC